MNGRWREFLRECRTDAANGRLGLMIGTLPIGIVVAIATGDPFAIVVLAILYGIIGYLMGIGETITRWFGEEPVDEAAESPEQIASPRTESTEQALNWWEPFETSQEPAPKRRSTRLTRALLGAAAFVFLLGLFGLMCYLVTNRPPKDMVALDILLAFAIIGGVGAVVGALSERI